MKCINSITDRFFQNSIKIKHPKLSLHITKNLNAKKYFKGNVIKFAVVDLEKSQMYPLNFVCLLPRNIGSKMKMPSEFSKRFGSESLNVAKELLNKALEIDIESDIRNEIVSRLKLLTPTPKNMTKCITCGNDFEVRKFGYVKLTSCDECRRKKREDHE